MNSNSLEQKWSVIKGQTGSGYSSLRISDETIPDLYLSIDVEGKRCVILSLPENVTIDFKEDSREYISVKHFNKSNHIIILLSESRFNEVFNAFIISVYYKIYQIQDNRTAANTLLTTYHEWSEFFAEASPDLLSFYEVMGLFGELYELNYLLNTSPADQINSILKSWTGPFGNGHDFCLPEKNTEIKTKENLNVTVSISSEFQLNPEPGKNLFLIVISVLYNSETSIPISKLIYSVNEVIIQKLGETLIFYKALSCLGITIRNAQDYDKYKFEVKSKIIYNCLGNDFPRLSKSELPEQISQVKYKLNLLTLDQYIIEKTNF